MIIFAAKMLRLPKLISKTLSVRLSLIVVGAMAILLMASLTVMLHYSRKAVKEEAIQKATQTLEGTVQHIDNILLSVEQAAGNIYLSLLPHIDNPDEVTEHARRLVETNPYVTGCAIAFKPNYFQGRELYMAYFHHTKAGADANDSPIVQSETFGNCAYTEQAWYTEPMEKGAPYWLNPLKGIEADVEPITTFCLPMPGNDGKPIAVIGVDVSLSLLSQIVLAVKPSPNSYCTLLGDDGSFIIHPNSDKLLHQTVFEQTKSGADSTVKMAAEAMVSGESGYKPFKMDGKDYIVFYKPFKRTAVPGRSMEELKWSAGIIYPEDDIFGDYNRLLYDVLAIAIIGLLLLYLLCRLFIHRQLLPLRLLAKSAQHIADGNYNEIIPDTRQQDEIGRLQNHFQQMQQSLAANVGELEQLTATLQEHGEDLHAAYEKAQQADRMKMAFLHNMTNQMTAPASAIVSDVNALCDATDSTQQTADSLARDIQQQGKTITELLNSMLNVSEEETEKGGRP